MKAILELDEMPKICGNCPCYADDDFCPNDKECKLREIEYSYDEVMRALDIACGMMSFDNTCPHHTEGCDFVKAKCERCWHDLNRCLWSKCWKEYFMQCIRKERKWLGD